MANPGFQGDLMAAVTDFSKLVPAARYPTDSRYLFSCLWTGRCAGEREEVVEYPQARGMFLLFICI